MKPYLSIKGIPRSVLVAGILAFMSDFCNSITQPTVPLLAVKLGASYTFIGTMVAASSLTALVLVQPVGILGDKRTKRPFLALAFLLYNVNFLLLIFATSPFEILIGRVLYGVGFAMFYTTAAALVLTSSPENTGLAVGFYATLMGTGFFLGPVVGGFVAEKLSYDASYFLSFCFASLAIVIALRGVKEQAVQREKEEEASSGLHRKTQALGKSGYSDLLKNRELLVPCVGAFFVTAAENGDIGFFPLFGKSLMLSEGVIGVFLGIRSLLSTATRIPTGRVAESFGHKRLMMTGMCLSALGMFLVPQIKVVGLIPMFLGLEGIGFGLFLISGNAYVGKVVDQRNRGAAVGIYMAFAVIGTMMNMIILGGIASIFGVDNAFRFISLMCILGLLIIIAISRSSNAVMKPEQSLL
jgi:DHA1 family multidrug resistance protein-like MFS transporter